jgi:hypothetical protein
MTTAPETSSINFSNYVMTHCMTCRAGWIRKNQSGGLAIVCLLNREPVWPEMAECSKFLAEGAPRA